MTDLRSQVQATLGDAYAIERELGGGGMSHVFVANEKALGRTVVVKVLTKELAAGVSAERFAREVKVAARLQQANIVPVFSTGEANGIPWYSMPYVSGESLRAKIAAGKPVSIGEAVHILHDVARALAFAHAEGVVHRDIKPENILLSGGAAMVTDFGIAKALTVSRTSDAPRDVTITQAGASIGTPAYMAPEQITGDPNIDHCADIYAWGVVAWELIAGKHPFADRITPGAMFAAHLSETPALLTAVRPDTPVSLAQLVAKCVEKDPSKRASSANDLLHTLDAVGSGAVTHRDAGVARAGGARVAAIAAGVLLIVSAGWFAWRQSPAGAATITEKSLAVLPFETVGGDTANAYFAEGMADELTTALVKVPGLRVAATSSAFSYRNRVADVREVGRALNVGAVLQGRVRREGTQMRVSAQLTSTADGILLWKNSYEREVKGLFAVQDELTRDIVNALRIKLGSANQPSTVAAVRDTTDAETYDLYMRGLFFLEQRGAGVGLSIDYFKRAIARDSNFARAWAELALAYSVLPLFSPVPVDSVLKPAREAIANAHRLNPASVDAYNAEGTMHLLALEWSEAGPAFERAVALDTTSAYRAYTAALFQSGRIDESLVQARRVTHRDPLSATTFAVAMTAFLNANHIEEGLAMARRANELDSTGALAHVALALALNASGKVDSARMLIKSVRRTPQTAPWLGYLMAATGDRAGAKAFVQTLERERNQNAFANVAEAWTYLGGGDTTRALDALERALLAREPLGFTTPFGMPAYRALRHSERFAAVIKGYKLDPASFGVVSTR